MPRTNRILIRSGTVAPTASDFAVGEPAFDKTAGKFYLKNAAGSMVEIGAGGGGSAELVFSYATTANLPATGDASLLYFVTDSGRMFRWVDAATKYVEVGPVGGGDATLRGLLSPPSPTGVSGTSASGQSVVSWTAPTVLAQTPITDYLVQYSTSPYTSWTTFSDGTSTATSATVTGLTNGTAYKFRVAAVNAAGIGSYSAASSEVTPDSAVYRAIPSMTSASAPSGATSTNLDPGNTAYWRSVLYGGSSADYWRVFDGSGNPGLKVDSASAGVTGWVQYAFPAGQKSAASGYRMKARTPDSGQAPPTVLLQGSDDGSSFTTVLSSTSLTWTADELKTFTFASTANYRYWRWTISPGSSGYADVGAIQLVQ